MTKKYKVSIAVKVPANFNIEVEAANEREAYKRALEHWDNGEEATIEDENYEETELDTRQLSAAKDEFDTDNITGLYIEEIEN